MTRIIQPQTASKEYTNSQNKCFLISSVFESEFWHIIFNTGSICFNLANNYTLILVPSLMRNSKFQYIRYRRFKVGHDKIFLLNITFRRQLHVSEYIQYYKK